MKRTQGKRTFGPVGDLFVEVSKDKWVEVRTLEGELIDQFDPGYIRQAIRTAIEKSKPILEKESRKRLAGMSRQALEERLLLVEKLALAAEHLTTYEGGTQDDYNRDLNATVSRPELTALYRAARGEDPVPE